MLRFQWLPLAALLLTSPVATADDFPPVYNSDADKLAEPMPAIEAAAKMQMPRGFQVQVFASEPDVQNPISITWDARGRLWIAENYTYAERSQRFDLALRDRVIILEDSDADGVADERTVFTDQVQMLTSVEVGHGGVWLMCPPQLLFVPDRDRDDRPDGPPEVVLDGFDVAKDNYHNFANGLRWGPDGWLYGRCGGSCPGRVGAPGTSDEARTALEGGIWRFHPGTKHFEVLVHGTTNPWGHDWNEFGDGFFVNTVNGHLWQLIPGAHYVRPFSLDPNPHVFELIDMHADHWHFDTGGEWNESRDGVANAYGGGHAHCGTMIYLADQWPAEYRGRLLTLNIHGRRANQEWLERQGSGYVAHHGPDTMLSADPFFRGMELSYGPDGAVYVIDWSDTGECHEHNGVHRTSGRVFRITHPARPSHREPFEDLRTVSAARLLEALTHSNEWFSRQARLALSERHSAGETLTEIGEPLRALAGGSDPVQAYRATTALHGIGEAESEFLRAQLTHPDEQVRAWAVRLLSDAWPIDDVFGPVPMSDSERQRVAHESQEWLAGLSDLAGRDPSGLVRLALASTLQRLPVASRATLAASLMTRSEDADDHNLPLLVWYGLIPLAEEEPATVARLAVASQWPQTQRLMARRLAEQIESAPEGIEELLSQSRGADLATRRVLLVGLAEGLKGWSRAPQPASWPGWAARMSEDADASAKEIIRDLNVLFGDGRALEQVRATVLDETLDIGLRRSALETLVARSEGDELKEMCLPLLSDARLNAVAAQGLSKVDDVEVAQHLIANYFRFRSPKRAGVIEILVSRSSFASALLDAVEAKRIPADALSAYDVRQIRSHGDPTLSDRVSQLWGEVRESTAEKLAQMAGLKARLSSEELATADLANGRQLFNQSCAKCHRLFGEGETVGPDLTGGNRNNLDYLLENVVDPSAVVSKDYRMTIVLLVNGRVLNGLVTNQNDRVLTLQTQTELQYIDRERIEATKMTDLSPMPDGLLDHLSPEQTRDLIAYLMHPAQVQLP